MASPVTPPLSQTDDDVEMQKTTAAAVVKHEIVMLGESTRAITERIEGLETALEVQYNFHTAQHAAVTSPLLSEARHTRIASIFTGVLCSAVFTFFQSAHSR